MYYKSITYMTLPFYLVKSNDFSTSSRYPFCLKNEILKRIFLLLCYTNCIVIKEKKKNKSVNL